MPGLLLVTPPGPEADALSAAFRARGYEVHQAGNGSAAVDLAHRRMPDVILLDPALSAMDRWHAVKRLNTEPTTMRIPVLTLVSEGDPGDLDRALTRIEEAVGSGRPRPTHRTPVPRTSRAPTPTGPPGTAPRPADPPRSPVPAPRVVVRSATPSAAPPSTAPPSPEPSAAPASPALAAIRVGAAPAPSLVSVWVAGPSRPPPPRSAPPEAPPQAASEGPASEGPTSAPPAARRPPSPPPDPDTSPEAPRSSVAGSILVVDDNAMNRDMLSRRLERRGFAVAAVESGEAALRLLGERTFDAVLLDWMMPGMSGIDALREIRRRWSAIELPVIMATAKSEAEDVLEALRADANDYVTKPLNIDLVHARLRTHLNLVEAHRALRASERRYRALLENTGDLIVQFAADGTLGYVSPAVRTLLGMSPEQFAGRPFTEWLHPIDRRAVEERQLLRAPSVTFVARMERGDGTYIWVETSSRQLRDDEAGGQRVQAVCRDVSEHLARVTGDEPPLPLGGDLLAHPTWRLGVPAPDPGSTAGEQQGHAGSSAGPPAAAPIVVVLGDPSGSPDEIGRRVAEAVAGARGAR